MNAMNTEIRIPKTEIRIPKTDDGILNGTTETQRAQRWGAAGRPAPNCGMKNITNTLTRARRDRRAFTLVALLLVLVILGTLAAIVLPKFSGVSQRGRVTAAATQISTFKTALDAFEVDMGYYPKGRNGLMDLIVQPRNGAASRARKPALRMISSTCERTSCSRSAT